MNRNKIVEEILNDIPEEIREGTDLQTLKLRARYLYLELCKKCHYDMEYNLGDIETKNKIFNSNEDEDKPAGICNEFSLAGVELFKKAGIDAIALDIDGNEYKEGKYMKDPLHIYFIFTLGERDKIGNKEFYLADPSFDLKRVQIGCQTKYFATHPTTIKNISGYPNYLSRLPLSEIRQMDEKLGYCKGEYTDYIIREIINQMKLKKEDRNDITFEGMVKDVDGLLKELKEKVFNKSKIIGISDRQSSYKMIFHQAFQEEMSRGLIDFDTTKGENGEYISSLTIKKGDQKLEYIYSDENGTYTPKNRTKSVRSSTDTNEQRRFTDLDDDPLLN